VTVWYPETEEFWILTHCNKTTLFVQTGMWSSININNREPGKLANGVEIDLLISIFKDSNSFK
jgi:hypothetical protein